MTPDHPTHPRSFRKLRTGAFKGSGAISSKKSLPETTP
jgi:hypothetical protein